MRLLSSDCASSSSSGGVRGDDQRSIVCIGVDFRVWHCFDDVVDVEEEGRGECASPVGCRV